MEKPVYLFLPSQNDHHGVFMGLWVFDGDRIWLYARPDGYVESREIEGKDEVIECIKNGGMFHHIEHLVNNYSNDKA